MLVAAKRDFVGAKLEESNTHQHGDKDTVEFSNCRNGYTFWPKSVHFLAEVCYSEYSLYNRVQNS